MLVKCRTSGVIVSQLKRTILFLSHVNQSICPARWSSWLQRQRVKWVACTEENGETEFTQFEAPLNHLNGGIDKIAEIFM